MPTIEQLEQALVKAHRAGDQRALKLIQSQIQKGADAEEWAGEPLDEMGTMSNFKKGFRHAFDKAAYGLEGAVKGIFGRDIDPEHQRQLDQGKAFVEHQGGGAKVGEFAGDVLPYMAGGAGAVRAGLSLPMTMAMQAGIGATVTPESFGERLKSGALAGVGEGVGNVLVRSLGRLTGGVKNVTPEAQRMIDEGIYPTLGGLKGGLTKSIEDKLTSLPFIGNGIDMGRRGAINEMNLAALRRGGIPEDAVNQIGFEGQEQLANYFNKQFGDALEGVRFDLSDPRIQEAVTRLAQEKYAGKGSIDAVNDFFANARAMRNIPEPTPPGTSVVTNINPNIPTYVSGKDFHKILQDLRTRSTTLRRGAATADQDTGQILRGMYDEIQKLARAQGASDKGALDAFDLARQQYAATAPAMRAGGMQRVAGQQEGVFTPRQYANANIANMNAMGQKAQVRQGKGFNQEFGSDAVKTLGNDYPDSGSVGRALTGLTLGGGLQYVLPGAPAAAIPATALSYALNSALGRRYLAGALPGQKALSNAIRSYAPYGGMVGAGVVGPMGSDY